MSEVLLNRFECFFLITSVCCEYWLSYENEYNNLLVVKNKGLHDIASDFKLTAFISLTSDCYDLKPLTKNNNKINSVLAFKFKYSVNRQWPFFVSFSII